MGKKIWGNLSLAFGNRLAIVVRKIKFNYMRWKLLKKDGRIGGLVNICICRVRF